MQQTIPFRRRIEAGDFQVTIPVPRKYVLGREDKTFRLEDVLLEPEYFSLQAIEYDMDPDVKDVKLPFVLEIEWNSVYQESPLCASWNGSVARLQKLSDIVENINKYFEVQSPAGLYTPCMFLDWVHVDALEDSDNTIKAFHEKNKAYWYAETQETSETSSSYLPTAVQSLEYVNALPFPTTTNRDILQGIRMRLHVAPNMMVAFSNDVLLRMMGYTDTTIVPRMGRQISFKNRQPMQHQIYVGEEAPTLSIQDIKPNRINLYLSRTVVRSGNETVLTNRTHENQYEKLSADCNKALTRVGKKMNIKIGLTYDKENNRFKWSHAADSKYVVGIIAPSMVAEKLGFGNVEKFTTFMFPKALPEVGGIKDAEKKARTLVYDTGMVIICNNHEGSLVTDQFSGTVMATLEPHFDGTMMSRQTTFMEGVSISYSKSALDIALYRFDESGKPITLGWKVAAYVQGKLVTKV